MTRARTHEAVKAILALVERHRRAIEARHVEDTRNRYLKRLVAPLPLPRDVATAYDHWLALVDFVNIDRSEPVYARDAAFWLGVRLQEEVILSKPAKTWPDVQARLAWLRRDLDENSGDEQPAMVERLQRDIARLMRAA